MAVVSLSSCSDDDDDDFFGPKDKWCEKEFTYTPSEGDPSSLDCFFYYSSGAGANTQGMASRADGQSWDCLSQKGLTVVVIGNSSSALAQSLTEKKFFVKTFSEGASVNADGEEVSGGKFKMNGTLWTAICLMNKELITSATASIPYPLKASVGYTEFTNPADALADEAKKFSFKKIAAQFLLDRLLS